MYAKNVWTDASSEKKESIFSFNEDYKAFLSLAKTERTATKEAIKLAEAAGFKNLEDVKSVKAGDKIYAVNKDKNFLAVIIGKKSIEEGMRVLGAHIDSPRLDIKQNPLTEKGGLAYFETHYYGGIKKYLYVTTPLAIHGVVYKKDGSHVDVAIGEDPTDPVVGVTDLLIHLSGEMMSKPANKVVEGENLDINVGSIPEKDVEADPVKATILKLLKEKDSHILIRIREHKSTNLSVTLSTFCSYMKFREIWGHPSSQCLLNWLIVVTLFHNVF